MFFDGNRGAHHVVMITAHRSDRGENHGVADLLFLYHAREPFEQIGLVLEAKDYHALELGLDGVHVGHGRLNGLESSAGVVAFTISVRVSAAASDTPEPRRMKRCSN
jgi:hypothetical protein